MGRELRVMFVAVAATAAACGASEDGSAEHSATGADLERPDPIDCAQSEVADGLRWLGGAPAAGTSALRDVAVLGGRAWTCADTGGVVSWDVTAPVPVVVPTGLDGAACSSLAADPDSGRLAIATESSVTVWDAELTEVFTWSADGPLRRVRFAVGATEAVAPLLVSAGQSGWSLLAADGTVDVASAATGGDARAALQREDLFYVAQGRGGVDVFERDGSAATKVGTLAIDPVLDLRWAGDQLLAATLESVVWIDVSDPSNPRIDAEVQTPGSATAAAMLGDKAVIADFTELTQARGGEVPGVVNVEPLIGEDALDRTRALAVDEENGRVYVAQWDSLQVFDNSCDGPAGSLLPGLRTVDFGVVSPGRGRALAVTVSNEGDAPLTLSSVNAELPGFSTDFTPVTLEPGSTSAFEVAFEATDSEAFRGSLVLESDDPDQPQYLLPLSANVRGVRVGEPLVPFRNIDVRGEVWDSEDARGKVLLLAYFADW